MKLILPSDEQTNSNPQLNTVTQEQSIKITGAITPKNIVVKHIIQIVESLSLPVQVVFDSLKTEDPALTPQFESYLAEESGKNPSTLASLLDKIFDSLTNDKV